MNKHPHSGLVPPAADTHELLMIMDFHPRDFHVGPAITHLHLNRQTDFEATKTDDFYLLAMRV